MEERIQKILSAAGLASRRRAEEYLTAGRVTVTVCAASSTWAAMPVRLSMVAAGR